jgi:hypothetical protein
MNRTKKLGIAIVAVLAVTAVAGAAFSSASEPEFRAESFPVTLEGSGSQKIGSAVGTVNCPTSNQTGTGKSAATWWSMKVSNSGCKIGSLAANVEWGECEIRYYTYSGYYIVCSGGVVKITVISTTCVVELKPQELKSVSYEAVGLGTKREIKILPNITGMTYTQNSKCPGGAGTFNNGTIGGEILLKGRNEKGEQEGIFIE